MKEGPITLSGKSVLAHAVTVLATLTLVRRSFSGNRSRCPAPPLPLAQISGAPPRGRPPPPPEPVPARPAVPRPGHRDAEPSLLHPKMCSRSSDPDERNNKARLRRGEPERREHHELKPRSPASSATRPSTGTGSGLRRSSKATS